MEDSRFIAKAGHKTKGALLFFLLFGVLFITGCQSGAKVSLVKNGQAQAVIVTADEPSLVAAYAAQELTRHVKEATGVMLPVVTESEIPQGYTSRVFLGVTKAAIAQGLEPDNLENDAFILRTIGSDLYILGKEEKSALPLDQYHGYSGTMFGVSEILERDLGVRWLWPGKLGTYVPQKNTISIGETNEVVAPRLLLREIAYHTRLQISGFGNGREKKPGFDVYPELYSLLSFSTQEASTEYVKALEVFMRRHRLGTSQPSQSRPKHLQYRMPLPRHAFHDWWLRYGKEHPEWFALRDDGTRGPKKGEAIAIWGGQYAGMCVSNPELHRFIVEKAWDGGGVLDLSEADVGADGFCQCPDCLAWDGPQEEDNPPEFASDKYQPRVVSDRYARFWKTVYDLAVKRNPDVKVVVYLYHNSFPAPFNKIELNKNIIAEFVVYGETGGWYPMTEEEDRWMREQWMGWKKTGMSLILRPNYMLSGYVMPEITTGQIIDFFKFAYENGMVAATYDSLRCHWAANGPMSYLHYRLLWNPELTAEDIRREYFSAFGPAARHVEKYFDYWEDYVHKEEYVRARPPLSVKNSELVIDWYPMMRRAAGAVIAFPAHAYPPAEAILDKALAAARESSLPEYAERVKFLKDGLEHAKLSTRIWPFLDYPLSDGSRLSGGTAPNDPEKMKKARQAMQELIEFRQSHQDVYIADYIAAVEEEREIGNIQFLFPRYEGVLDKETAFQSRWPEKAVRVPAESNLRMAESRALPHAGWRFRKDMERRGDMEGWHLPETSDDDWQNTEIGKVWEPGYIGVGWYRGKFESPKVVDGGAVYLHFGAVDETCWVWVNGTYVGRHHIGPYGWATPFRLEISNAVKPGENLVTARVMNTAFAGGIWLPVKLEVYEPMPSHPPKGE